MSKLTSIGYRQRQTGILLHTRSSGGKRKSIPGISLSNVSALLFDDNLISIKHREGVTATKNTFMTMSRGREVDQQPVIADTSSDRTTSGVPLVTGLGNYKSTERHPWEGDRGWGSGLALIYSWLTL